MRPSRISIQNEHTRTDPLLPRILERIERKSERVRVNEMSKTEKERNPRDIPPLTDTLRNADPSSVYPMSALQCGLTRLPSYYCGQIFILRAIAFGSITLLPMDSTSQ